MRHFAVFAVLVGIFVDKQGWVNGQTVAWPQPDKTLGFWPLNNYYKLKDISGRGLHGTSEGGRVNTGYGPFGDPNESYEARSGGIFSVRNTRALSLVNSSFTISFFLKHSTTTEDGLLEFYGKSDAGSDPAAFSLDTVDHFGSNKNNFGVTANNVETEYEVIVGGSWMFLSVRFDFATTELSISGRHGTIYKGVASPQVIESMMYSDDGILVGKTRRSGSMNTFSAMSCLTIYSTFLSDGELAQLQDACRLMQSSSPCGAPRLPIPAIPSDGTSVTRQGQFPWLASIRYQNAHYCAASILDSYFVLTSASCFLESMNSDDFEVVVGEFDTSSQDSHEFVHDIKAIKVHPDFERLTLENDVAVLELSDEIDMSNPYVNDICMPRYDVPTLVNSTDKFYVPGWGSAGRNDLVSATSQRYVVGNSVRAHDGCAGTTGLNALTFDCLTDPNAPDAGDKGTALTQAIGTGGHGVAPRLLHQAVFGSTDTACSPAIPRFEGTAKHWPWIQSVIACYLPEGRTPETCPH